MSAFRTVLPPCVRVEITWRHDSLVLPTTQKALVLHAAKQPYTIQENFAVPALVAADELLIQTEVIGLNPIDWKSPDYGFGIPELPFLSGRELVGTVVTTPKSSGRIHAGDKVIVISTDYRDLRKAAYQQYVIAKYSNIVRLPRNTSPDQGAATGVAFATSVLALGICLGISFAKVLDGPDLQRLISSLEPLDLPLDVRDECLNEIPSTERASKGDWIAIWGASATCALIVNQLARLAGFRTVLVLDTQKHATLLREHKGYAANAVVDSHDPDRAIEMVRSITNNNLRFAIDVVGRQTSELLLQCLEPQAKLSLSDDSTFQKQNRLTPPTTPPSALPAEINSHLVGFSGLPKQNVDGVVYHTVPVKVFHEIDQVGEAIVTWLYRLLESGELEPPKIIDHVDGFDSINKGLDRMRAREISGGRLVAKVAI